MRELLRFAFRNTACLVNVSKLHRDFASLGFSVGKNTLFEYLGFLADSFLLFLIPRHERSLRKQAHNPKKLHVVDPGLVAAFQANPDRDVGRKLETTVFLHVRRERKDLFYQANGGEVDLVDEDGDVFWNTCWSLTDPETLRPERQSMSFARSRRARAKGFVLYHELSPALAAKLPEAMPAWQWLLERKKSCPPIRATDNRQPTLDGLTRRAGPRRRFAPDR